MNSIIYIISKRNNLRFIYIDINQWTLTKEKIGPKINIICCNLRIALLRRLIHKLVVQEIMIAMVDLIDMQLISIRTFLGPITFLITIGHSLVIIKILKRVMNTLSIEMNHKEKRLRLINLLSLPKILLLQSRTKKLQIVITL